MTCGDCEKCPFAVNGKPPHTPVLGDLPHGAVGVLVGEGPGPTEVEKGTILANGGTVNRALLNGLRESGLQREKLAVIYATACKGPAGRTDRAMRAAVKACAPLFAYQYEKVKHLPTLAMGKWAGGAVEKVRHGKMKARAIKNERGFLRDNDTLILTWSPMVAYFANAWEMGNFECDLRRFERMVTGRLYPKPKSLVTNATAKDLTFVWETARECGFVAVDIETGSPDPAKSWLGKNPLAASLKSIAIGTPEVAASFLYREGDNSRLSVLADILQDARITKTFQNGWHFDIPVLNRYGLNVAAPIEDTRTMRRTVSTTSPLSLRYMGSLFADIHAWKSEEVLENEDEK